ncbi:MAG: CRISPR-associated endonuclease Cas1 [Amphritea sp.]
MCRVILDRRNLTLEYATDCVIIRVPDKPPRSLPLKQLEQLICLHSVQLTTQLIGQLQKRGIDLIVINQRYVDHSFSLFADQQKQVERRCRQYQWQTDDHNRMVIASKLCRHKFQVMARIARAEELGSSIKSTLQKAIDRCESCLDESALRGIEGAAQRELFACWKQKLPPQLGFKNRQRRPPPDPVNSTLSLTYTLLHQEAVRQCKRHGLDPQLGFYHRTAFGRQSLACDLMEPLRPKAEAWVVDLLRKGTLNKRMYSMTNGACLLGKEGRTQYYSLFEQAYESWQRSLGATARWLCLEIDNGVH